MRRLGRLRPWLGAIISVLCIAGTAYWISRQPTPEFPSAADALAGLATAAALTLVTAFVRGWRWKQIIKAVGQPTGGSEPYYLTAVAYMGNTVLPARGGDILKVGLLTQRTSGDWKTLTGTLIPERLLDMTALATLLVTLGATATVREELGWIPLVIAGAAMVALGAGLAIYHELRVRGWFQTLADRIRPFTRSTRVLLSGRGAELYGASVLLWLLEGVVLWVLVASSTDAISFPEAALVVVLASLVTAVPAAPGFLGTFDAAVIFGLKQAGLSSSEAFTLAIQYRIVLFGPITFTGLVVAVTRYGGLARLRTAWRQTEEAVEDELDGHPHPSLASPRAEPERETA